MSYFVIEDFKAGVDVRRNRFVSLAGTLVEGVNVHITRGGDVEIRKAFADKGGFSADTFGLATDRTGMVTFGSVAAPASVPPGVTYQRLQAPTGAAMAGIVSHTLSNGLLYVVARYADGSVWHFYNGELVGDWGGGIVRADMVDNAGIAAHLKSLIDAGGIYTTTIVGDTITVTGPVGVDYATETQVANAEGGVDDQLLNVSLIQAAVAPVAEAQAAGYFTITAGEAGGGGISSVKVDATELLSAAVPFGVTARETCGLVASAINDGFATHGYLARAETGRVYLYAPDGLGASANGRVIEVTATGKTILSTGSFSITSGSASAGVNKVTMVKADGVPLMSAAVDWTTSNSATAAAVAAEINTTSATFNACAIGETVFVSPAVVKSTDAAEITIELTLDGNVGGSAGAPPPDGTPGTDDPDGYPRTCVSVDAWVITSNGLMRAGDVALGDHLLLCDPDTGIEAWGAVTYSERANVPGVRIVGGNGASLSCSDTAPIPTDRGYRNAPDTLGRKVAQRAGWEGAGEFASVQITDIVLLGRIDVQHITVGDRCFWASDDGERFFLHHNLKMIDP